MLTMTFNFLALFILAVNCSLAQADKNQVDLFELYSQHEQEIRSKAVTVFPQFVFFSYSAPRLEKSGDDSQHFADAMFFIRDQIEKYVRESNSNSTDSVSSYVRRIYTFLVPNSAFTFEELKIQILFQGFEGEEFYYDIGIHKQNLDGYYTEKSIPINDMLEQIKSTINESSDKALIYYQIGAIDQAIAVQNLLDYNINFVCNEVYLTPSYYVEVARSFDQFYSVGTEFPAHPIQLLNKSEKYYNENEFDAYLNLQLMAEPRDDQFLSLIESLEGITFRPFLQFLRCISLARDEYKILKFEDNRILDFVFRTSGFTNFSNHNNEASLNHYRRAELLFADQASSSDIRKQLILGIQASVHHSPTWNLLGVTYRIEGRYWEALACFRQSLRIDPENAFPMANLAIVYSELGFSSLSKPMAVVAVLHSKAGEWPYDKVIRQIL